MSMQVVAVGLLLTFVLPRFLPEETGIAAVPAPAASPAPTTLVPTDVPDPTPTPVPKAYRLKLDDQGKLTDEIQLVSDDGMAILRLSKGTRVIADGHLLDSVTLTRVKMNLRADIGLVGLAYDFGPGGAILDPPGVLTVNYNPTAQYPFLYPQMMSGFPTAPIWTNNGRVYMAFVDGRGALSPSIAAVSCSAGSATGMMDHLGTIILYIV